MVQLWTFKLLVCEKQKNLRWLKTVDKLEIQMGIQLFNPPNLGLMTPISVSSPILRLTGDPGEHERFQGGNGNGLRMSHVVHLLSPGFQEQRP